MDLWTEEHLSKAAFSKGDMVDDLLKQMEDLYTLHFGESDVPMDRPILKRTEHGDSKKARDKLRRQDRDNTVSCIQRSRSGKSLTVSTTRRCSVPAS